MSRLTIEKKKILCLVIMLILGSVFTLIYLAMNGNTDQVFGDIVNEYTAVFQSNKSAERNLLFGLIFTGILVYAVCFFLTIFKHVYKEKTKAIFEENIYISRSKEFICALAAMSATCLLIYGNSYQIIVAAFLYAMILYIIDRELIYVGICTYFLGVFTFISLFRLYAYIGGENSANNMMVAMFSLIISSLPLVFPDKKKTLIRAALIESLFIPCGLLIYLSNKYKYGEKIVTIDVPGSVKIFIFLLFAAFVIEALCNLFMNWKVIEKIDHAITIGSCVTIMAFNRFDGTGAVMPTDMHHPFENIIGFSQVFELGQSPFKNYIPVSGMYSIIQGAIFDLFGDGGTFANYYVTNNLFYLLVIILMVVLLKVQLEGAYVLLLSLVFFMRTYNRLVFMLPIMLLLIWPKLVEKKNAWIVTFFLTSLFQGLYYPLYGAATCIAFFPLLIWQIVTFVKSGELEKAIKTVRFWIVWGVCVALLFACTGCLLGTLKHMLAMSGQSVLADGISRFGQIVPGWFFPYLGDNHLAIRIGLYCIFTVMIPVGFVWLAFALTAKVADISFDGKRIHIGDVKTACITSSVVIMPIICYTYTFVRLDIDNIYARSSGVLFTGVVLMLIFAWKYVYSERLKLLLVMSMLSIPAVVNTVGIFATDSNSKLAAYYTVPENYIYVENDKIEKLGTGFIYQPVYDGIETTYMRFLDKDRENSYMGDPSVFGYFYLLGIKGDGAMEVAPTVKSYSAAEESIEIARKNSSIIAPSFVSYSNYYFYHWLLASGEYYWDEELWEFIPNHGKYSREEIIGQNKNNAIASDGMDLGKTASSWGASMESLEELFSDPGIKYDTRTEGNCVIVDFSNGFDGDSADFLYIEFDGMESYFEYTLYNLNGEVTQEESALGKYFMKKNYNPNMTVQIRWQDDNSEIHTMNCKMSKGKLLIPLGAGSKWLFNEHNNISVYVYQDGNEILCPDIENIRMLKIQEIN